jgi:type I restriction enzyme, S subunit
VIKRWYRKALGDVLSVQNGYAFDSKSFGAKGFPLIRIRDLKAGASTQTRYAGDFDPKYVVNAGDFLIGMDGDFGCYEWKGEPALLNQRVCRLQRFDHALEPRFLFYGINAHLKEIQEVTGYTTVKHLSSKQILSIEMLIPAREEQRRIVSILDEAFEGIATAKDNAEKNLQNATDLFDSHLQSIDGPKISLGELVNIKTGKLDANAEVEGGEYPFFTCAREIYSIDKYAFDCEALLLAGNNAVGDFNVKHYKGKFNAYQRTYVITINEQKRALCRFLYFELLKGLTRFKAQSVGAGTKFLKMGMIKDLQVSLPEMSEQRRLASLADQVLQGLTELEEQYEKKLAALDELKKSLLHQAFTGQL